jgi:hypothetical protein
MEDSLNMSSYEILSVKKEEVAVQEVVEEIWQCIPVVEKVLAEQVLAEPHTPMLHSILNIGLDIMHKFQETSGIEKIGFYNLSSTLKCAIEIVEGLHEHDSGATKKFFVVRLLSELLQQSSYTEGDAFYKFITDGTVDSLIDVILAASKGRLRVNQKPMNFFQRTWARYCCFFWRRNSYPITKTTV